LASSPNRSQVARGMPRPELNPLLNPLLADNMGRWAEVYFTSPPERRVEAVLKLLRELEAQNSDHEGRSASLQVVPAIRAEAPAAAFESATTNRNPGDLRHCDTCGHDNPGIHQFCGMCGTQLGGTAPEQPTIDSERQPQAAWNAEVERPAYAESYAEYREPPVEEPLPRAEESARDPYDLTPFQSIREKERAAALEYDRSPSGRYWYYIATVLAILILALGYLAWRGSRRNQNVQGAVPPPPAASADTAPAATVTAGSQTAADNLEHLGLQGNGAEEFGMAERYLNGTGGQARDSAEAVKWLWKSIAKHNGPAMQVLADLYLKGDGVSKNCDQARVLLDSAARQGMAGAAERLRNLQAFGCQ